MVAVQVTSTQPYTAWLMTIDAPDPANPGAPSILDVWDMMLAIAPADYRCTLVTYADPGQAATFMLTISKADFPDQQAPVGGYVVFDGTYATVMDAVTYQQKYTPNG